MKKVTVKAIFRGTDGSCGYKKNTEYTLIVKHEMCANITIKNAAGGGECEYSSFVAYMKNWDNIRIA